MPPKRVSPLPGTMLEGGCPEEGCRGETRRGELVLPGPRAALFCDHARAPETRVCASRAKNARTTGIEKRPQATGRANSARKRRGRKAGGVSGRAAETAKPPGARGRSHRTQAERDKGARSGGEERPQAQRGIRRCTIHARKPGQRNPPRAATRGACAGRGPGRRCVRRGAQVEGTDERQRPYAGQPTE